MKVGNFIYYNIKELVAIRFIFWHTNKKSLQIPKGQSKSVYRTTQWPKEKVQKDKQLSTKHIYKTKDRVTRNPLKTGGELRCSGRVSSSCSTSDTRRVNLVPNPVICMNEESNRKCLRQVEHIRGHLWHRYSITVNQVVVATVKLSK
jgi:hypothetical protein